MGRVSILVAALLWLTTTVVQASDYVPGKTRDDGLYLPPHFRSTTDVVQAAEAWFDGLPANEHEQVEKDLPPAAAGAPPAPPIPPERRH